MREQWVTSTAKWIAAARARESNRPDRLFSDPHAALLAGDTGNEILTRSELAGGGENIFLAVRTRYFDDLIVKYQSQVGQIVLLGAGFDTRAFRLPLKNDLQVFELDLPDVFAEKESVLSGILTKPKCNRTTVPTDLCGEWYRDLLQAGYQASAQTIWVAEGLFFYLSPSQVDSVLLSSSSLSTNGSLFAADFSQSGILVRDELKSYLKWLASLGLHPPFCHDDPFQLFTNNGWRTVNVEHPGHANANYGRFPSVNVTQQQTGNSNSNLVTAFK